MTESSSFSSLLALVDSHLSKCNLQTNEAPGKSNSSPLRSPLHGSQTWLSETNLSSPSPILPLPPFSISDNPINNILAEQVSNMLKAKAKKEEEAKENLANKLKKLSVDDNEDVIDLMKAIQGPKYQYVPMNDEESRGSSPDFQLLNSEEFELDDEPKINEEVFPELLPCTTDMSYILTQKMKKGKCSPFGKVLTAKLRPVAAPYLHEKVVSTVKRFDFNTKSPCDCIMEKLRRPTTYSLPNDVRFGIFDVEPIVNRLHYNAQ